jgi:hypothetical protein
MTQDEIIKMLRASCDKDRVDPEQNGFWVIVTEELEHFANQIAEHTLANIDPSKFMSYQEGMEAGRLAEREACAEVCKKHADVYAGLEQNPTAKSAWAACIDNRDAIRARSNP